MLIQQSQSQLSVTATFLLHDSRRRIPARGHIQRGIGREEIRRLNHQLEYLNRPNGYQHLVTGLKGEKHHSHDWPILYTRIVRDTKGTPDHHISIHHGFAPFDSVSHTIHLLLALKCVSTSRI